MTLEYEPYLFKKGFLKEADGQPAYTQGRAVIETLRLLARTCKTLPEFICQLEKEPHSQQNSPIQLMTFHASKGLEFDQVYLMDCMEGITSSLDERQLFLTGEPEPYEESRRLFYVAMTRARSHLEVLGTAKRYLMDFDRCAFYTEAIRAAKTTENTLADPSVSKAPSHHFLDEFSQYPAGARIRHRRFGEGTILQRDDEIATIQFPDELRRISLRVTTEKGILEKIS